MSKITFKPTEEENTESSEKQQGMTLDPSLMDAGPQPEEKPAPKPPKRSTRPSARQASKTAADAGGNSKAEDTSSRASDAKSADTSPESVNAAAASAASKAADTKASEASADASPAAKQAASRPFARPATRPVSSRPGTTRQTEAAQAAAEDDDSAAPMELVFPDTPQYITVPAEKGSKTGPVKIERVHPDLSEGLSTEQVEIRTPGAANVVEKRYSRSYASIFIGNICTFFNLLCLLAGIALVLANTKGVSNYMVLFITALNIIIGIIQEIRSKWSIDKLSLLGASYIKVVRNGETVEIPTGEIVVDDVILLETGAQVPVDCYLAEGNVEVNESILTGESVSVKKNIGDLVYAGSFISGGNGKLRAEKVGKETYIEKLTVKAKKYKRPKSEIMNSTQFLIKCIAILIVPIAIGTFLIAYHNTGNDSAFENVIPWIFSQEVNYAIQRTCTVVIGMIPSGMLLLTSIAMAVGIIRLTRCNTLVQDMYSLEMLARVDVLCLDKTGTITDGQMKVNDTIILNTVGDYSMQEIMGSMLKALNDNNHTSIALQNHFGYSDRLTPVTTIPFNSKRKLSAVTFDDVGTFVMGAPEFVLKPYPAKVERMVKQLAQSGFRVLAVAYSQAAIAGDRVPSVVKPIAIISIADNIREDAIPTLKWFADNDVSVRVISGDNPVTVAEVARRAGIEHAEKFISLEGLSDREVEDAANKYTVFGRVSPEQKAVLIRSMKSQGHTVAMTGDGVNDILAMKEADCAISVAAGSDAARNVSHLVLMDNNFSSMPKIVAEGRRVINNIMNSSCLYLMKTLFTAILAVICICMSQPYLFLPQNMLLLEFGIIGVPSFFLSLQPNKDRVHGRFITHVLSGAVAGAVVMILCVMSMYITKVFNDDFLDYYKPMCMLALTFSGFVMVYRTCQPLNLYRTVLCAAVLAICIVGVAVPYLTDAMFYTGWLDLQWDYAKVLVVVVVVMAAFPISGWMLKLMHFIMPSSVGKTREPHESHKHGGQTPSAGGKAQGQSQAQASQKQP
ncbi:MAG: HAD-IC family P-type ATPase [Clostridia bacterium]|nr:HAD-IC family P-type ATPase [Clostridia bacterium]